MAEFYEGNIGSQNVGCTLDTWKRINRPFIQSFYA